jgi:hypothetical protein
VRLRLPNIGISAIRHGPVEEVVHLEESRLGPVFHDPVHGLVQVEDEALVRLPVRRNIRFVVEQHEEDDRVTFIKLLSVVSGYAVVDFAAGSDERISTQTETEVGEVVLFVPVEDFLWGRLTRSMNWFERTRAINLNQTPNEFKFE